MTDRVRAHQVVLPVPQETAETGQLSPLGRGIRLLKRTASPANNW